MVLQKQQGRIIPMKKNVRIFTDGACRGNPGPGGWGAVLYYDKHKKTLYGGEKETTNNRMELTAAIKTLASLKESCVVDLTTDSKYVKTGAFEWMPNWKKNNWRTAAKKLVKNVELWKALDEEMQRHEIRWHWVKGHAGHPDNEEADRLANRGIDELV